MVFFCGVDEFYSSGLRRRRTRRVLDQKDWSWWEIGVEDMLLVYLLQLPSCEFYFVLLSISPLTASHPSAFVHGSMASGYCSVCPIDVRACGEPLFIRYTRHLPYNTMPLKRSDHGLLPSTLTQSTLHVTQSYVMLYFPVISAILVRTNA